MDSYLNKLQRVIEGIFFVAVLFFASDVFAKELYWSGGIDSYGENVGPIVLQRGETYSIEVSGSFYMGRWYRNGRSIINDACYEFNAHNQPASIPVLQNSLGVSYCSFYNPDHYYQSSPFVSDGRPLWFRIYDTDYRDNRGGLNVSVFWHRTASAPYNQEFQSIKLFNALKQQSSNNFKHNRFPEVYVNTSSWDTMPYHMSAPVRLTLTVDYGKEVYLSSKRNKKSGIYVDNFLMFVVESAEGTKIFSVGRVPKHTYRSEEVTRVSPNNLHPGVVNLTKYLPHNTVVNMTVYALDFGGHAGMSDIYWSQSLVKTMHFSARL